MWCKDLPHKMYVGQWPTFHGPMILSYFLKTFWWRNLVLQILIRCNINFDLHIYTYIYIYIYIYICVCVCRSVTYILWCSDSALHIQYYLMNKPPSLDIDSCDMGHWPVFHDLAILNPLPISAYSGLLKFDMKIFVNVARLEIGQWFTQDMMRGASLYFGHTSSFHFVFTSFLFIFCEVLMKRQTLVRLWKVYKTASKIGKKILAKTLEGYLVIIEGKFCLVLHRNICHGNSLDNYSSVITKYPPRVRARIFFSFATTFASLIFFFFFFVPISLNLCHLLPLFHKSY